MYNIFIISFQVHWVQQQHEKKRRKRDFESSAAPFAFFSGVAPAARHNHPRYRAVTGRSFPDPLFKEEWYLVRFNLTIVPA